MSLEIENKSALNVTLKSAAGSLHDPESGKLLKNVRPTAIILDIGNI